MTITPNITKAELIALIAHALRDDGRTEELALFYTLAAYARDVQEVMQCKPDGVNVEYAS